MAWEHWLEAVSGLRVDALIPPQAVLDPILAERAVVLPLAGGGDFALRPTSEGTRMALPANATSEDAFGTGETPLAWDQLSPGPLTALAPEEQSSYVSAVLLGAYGLSPALDGDAEGAFVIPYNLRPQRNRLNRFLAVALFFLVAVVSVAAVWREYVARKTCLTELQAEVARLEREIERASGNTKTDASAKAADESREKLAKEMTDIVASLDRPSMAAALVELTEIVGDETWCTAFSWQDGSLSIELQEDEEDLELVHSLDLSPVIGDVLEESKRKSGNKYYRKLKMNARWDLSGESAKRAERQPTEEPDEAGTEPPVAPDMAPPPGIPEAVPDVPELDDAPDGDVAPTPPPGVPPPMRTRKEGR
jgi:hypothetical protein